MGEDCGAVTSGKHLREIVTQLEAFLCRQCRSRSGQGANGEHCKPIDQERFAAFLPLECEKLRILPGETTVQSATVVQLDAQYLLLSNPRLNLPDTGQAGIKAR